MADLSKIDINDEINKLPVPVDVQDALYYAFYQPDKSSFKASLDKINAPSSMKAALWDARAGVESGKPFSLAASYTPVSTAKPPAQTRRNEGIGGRGVGYKASPTLAESAAQMDKALTPSGNVPVLSTVARAVTTPLKMVVVGPMSGAAQISEGMDQGGAGGAAKAIRGLTTAALSPYTPLAVTNPTALLKAVVGSELGGGAGYLAGKTLGADDGWTDLLSAIGELFGGYKGANYKGKAAKNTNTKTAPPSATEEAKASEYFHGPAEPPTPSVSAKDSASIFTERAPQRSTRAIEAKRQSIAQKKNSPSAQVSTQPPPTQAAPGQQLGGDYVLRGLSGDSVTKPTINPESLAVKVDPTQLSGTPMETIPPPPATPQESGPRLLPAAPRFQSSPGGIMDIENPPKFTPPEGPPQLEGATTEGADLGRTLSDKGSLPIDNNVVKMAINETPEKLNEYHAYTKTLLEKATDPAEIDAAKKAVNSINYVRYTKSLKDPAYGNSMQLRDEFIFDEPTAEKWSNNPKPVVETGPKAKEVKSAVELKVAAETKKTATPPTVKKTTATSEPAATPKTEMEKMAVDDGGSTNGEVISDESGVPVMKVEKPLARAVSETVTPESANTINEIVPSGKKAVARYSDGSTESITIEPGERAFTHKDKSYIVKQKGNNLEIQNSYGEKLDTVPLYKSPEETLAVYLEADKPVASQQAAPPTTKEPEAKGRPINPVTEGSPAVKAVRKSAAEPGSSPVPPARATTASATAKRTQPPPSPVPPARSTGVPKPKAAGATTSASSERVSEPTPVESKPKAGKSADPMTSYLEQTVKLLDKVKDTDIHTPLKSVLDELAQGLIDDKPALGSTLKEFKRLRQLAEDHAEGLHTSAGKVIAKTAGSKGTVFGPDGKKIGTFENRQGKIHFFDKSDKEIHVTPLQEGQWNEKALTKTARDIFKG